MDDKMMKINLLIDCQRYPLNIRREDELLNKYRSWRPELSSDNHWAMAALELAFDLTKMKDKNDTQPYLNKIEELAKELDNYINKE